MKRQKKLMLLGGIRYLLPVIDAAHQLGHHVITCDYLPGNIAHRYSDEYHNVSIVDKEAVLKLARELEIDGIMSFAVDPGVETAAYVQEQMGLPSMGPYESVRILQNKDLFRAFLAEHGFNVPAARSFTSIEDALTAHDWYPWPVIVKPTDSAGSKGVTRVDTWEELLPALHHAFAHTLSGKIIVEEFIEKAGCSSDTDSFSINGKLAFVSYSAQRFDVGAANPYTPAAYSWPSTFTKEQENELTDEIQRLLSLLKMHTSIYNIETRVGTNGKTYIMELSPRGGGNRLAEMLRYATGVDLITNAVRAAMGDQTEGVEQTPYVGHWAEIILHADSPGTFERVLVSKNAAPYVQETDLWVRGGDMVNTFRGANDAIGTLVLRFNTEEEMMHTLDQRHEWISVKTTQHVPQTP